jgi:hypothetical protein
MRNFLTMLRNRDPGQGTPKECRRPGITPPDQQALKGRQKPRMDSRHPIFIVYGRAPRLIFRCLTRWVTPLSESAPDSHAT